MDIKSLFRRIGKSLVIARRPTNRAALLRHGVAASIEHDSVLSSLSFTFVVDVGANRGQFSLAARHFHPSARIVAFEPLASAAEVYEKAFGRDRRVRLHRTAIGPDRGPVLMQRSGREDSSSMLPIAGLMSELFPGTQAVGTEKIDVAPLTDFVTQSDFDGPALLKIDVQGFELEVLKSAEPILPFFDRIYVEASFIPLYTSQPLAGEIIDYLHSRNFRLAGFMNPSFRATDGSAIQSDLLFVNQAKP